MDREDIGMQVKWLEDWARPDDRDASVHKHENGWGVVLMVKMGSMGWSDVAMADAHEIGDAIAAVREQQLEPPARKEKA